jgi:hypothetical protein
MKHVIRIPELAQRLGVDARTAEELAAMSVRYPERNRWACVSAGTCGNQSAAPPNGCAMTETPPHRLASVFAQGKFAGTLLHMHYVCPVD